MIFIKNYFKNIKELTETHTKKIFFCARWISRTSPINRFTVRRVGYHAPNDSRNDFPHERRQMIVHTLTKLGIEVPGTDEAPSYRISDEPMPEKRRLISLISGGISSIDAAKLVAAEDIQDE
jgi:hypothetical protein